MAPKRKRGAAEEEEEEFVEIIDDDSDDEMNDFVDDSEEDDGDFKEKPKKKKKEEDDGKKKKSKKESTKKGSKKEKETKETKKKSSGGKKASTSSGPKKKDLTIKDEKEARQVVLDLFKKTNRPFNMQNVIDQSKGQLKKAMATKCVEHYEKKGNLSVKVNGKTKIWWISQEGLEVLSKEELKEIDTEIKELQEELARVRSEATQLTNDKARLMKAPKTEDLPAQIAKERADLEKKKEKLESLQSGTVKLCTMDEKKEALKSMDRYLKEWKARKRLTKEFIDKISESTEKKPAELIEDLGIDTDEMVGVSIDQVGKLTQ